MMESQAKVQDLETQTNSFKSQVARLLEENSNLSEKNTDLEI
jgi:regulator of replication initiation timing